MIAPEILTLPLVSICIPTYNGEDFLQEALDSVKTQTYPHLEIVLSDDGSQDNTLAIARDYSGHPIHIHIHARLGLVQNWNFCVQKANGKYIKFLFQDDYLAETCVEELVAAIEGSNTERLAQANTQPTHQNIGLAFCTRKVRIDTSLDYADSLTNLHHGWSYLSSSQTGQTLLADPRLTKIPYNKIGEPSNTLIPRQVLEKLGGFDSSFRQLPDLDMWFRIMASYDIAFVNQELSTFRVHSQQTTARNASDSSPAWQEIYQLWMKMLTHKQFIDLPFSVRGRLRRALWLGLLREFTQSILKQPWKRLDAIALIRQNVMNFR